MVQKETLAVRVSRELIPKIEEACKKLKLKRSDCLRLALEMFVKLVLASEGEVEEEEEGRKLVVNVQNLSIQPLPVFEMGEEVWENLLKILKAISSPSTSYPQAWKQWAIIALNELEKLRKANKRREANTIYT